MHWNENVTGDDDTSWTWFTTHCHRLSLFSSQCFWPLVGLYKYIYTYVLILYMIALLHCGYAGPKEAGLRPLASKNVVLRCHDIL